MKKFLLFAAVVVIVGAGAWYFVHDRGGSLEASPSPSPTATATLNPTPTATHTVRPTASKTPTPTPGLIVHETQVFHVSIANFAFFPSSVTVKRGDVVAFKNNDTTAHTVTSLNGSFDSGIIQAGGSWNLETASLAPGTYAFHCNIHPSMQGTVIVQ